MARRDDTLEVVFIDVEARTKDLDEALRKIATGAQAQAQQAGQAIAASLTPALNGAASAAREAAQAQAPFEQQIAALAKGVVDLEASFKSGSITQGEYNKELRRLRDETTALVNAQTGFGANSREAAAALKITDATVKELALSVRNTRSAFIAGRIGADEFRETSERLKGEIDGLFRSTNLTTDQQLKLNIASATAERGLASLRGESSRLGLAWNIQVGLSNQLGQSLRGLGPIGGAAAGSLGLMSKALDSLSRPLDASKISFDGFLQSAIRAPRVLATATAALTALAIAGMARLAQQAARVADDIDKSARSVGLAAEEYQELQFALGQSGVKADGVRTALGNLNTRIGEAINGNERYRETLTGLGVDLEGLRDGTTGVGDALSQIADGIAGIQSPAEQARVAAQLFGRSLGNQLLPALKDGAAGLQALRDQAREMGLVISGDAIVSLVEYADTVEVLKRQFQTAGVEISAAFIPILRDYLIPLIQNTLVPWLQNAARVVSDFARTFVDAGEEGQQLRARLVEMLSPILRIGDSIIGAGKGFLAFSNYALGSVAAVGAVVGDLSVQLAGLVRQFTSLQEGLAWWQRGNLLEAVEVLRRASNIDVRIDFAQTGQAALDAAAPFFERANRFSLEAGENFGRAFLTGYEDIIEGLSVSARRSIERGSGNLFDVGENAGGILGAGTAAGFEQEFAEGSLAALRQALARANTEFERAADDAGRAAATALKNQIQAAIKDIEARFGLFAPDPTAAAREWTRRLLAEVEFGLKDFGTVFDLLAPVAEALRAEVASALRGFGIDSSEYQDALAKLRVIEDALKRLEPFRIEIDTSPLRDFVQEYQNTQRALRDIAEAERIRRDTARAQLFANATPSTQGPPGRDLVAEVNATAAALKNLQDAAVITRDTFLAQLAEANAPSTQGPPGRDLEREAAATAGALRDLAAAAAIARDTMIAERLALAGPTIQGPPGRDLTAEQDSLARFRADTEALNSILEDTLRQLLAAGAPLEEINTAFERMSRSTRDIPAGLAESVALANMPPGFAAFQEGMQLVSEAGRRSVDQAIANAAALEIAESQLASLRQRAAIITGTALTPTQELVRELEALALATPLLSEAVRELIEEIILAGQAADARARAEADEESVRLQLDAAEQAAVTWVNAVGQSANQWVNAIRDFSSGNVGGGLAGLLGGVSGIVSLIDPVIGAVIGVFGGLLGNLFGQQARSTEDLERTRAGSNASRSAPAVQIAFSISEPRFTFDTDFHSPQTRQAMRAIFDDWMDEFVRRTGLATLLRDRLAVT